MIGLVVLAVFRPTVALADDGIDESIPVGVDVTSTLKQQPPKWESIIAPQLERRENQLKEQQRLEAERQEAERIEQARLATVVPAPAVVVSTKPTVQVGNSYDYGQCTWYVANRRAVPSNWGSAGSWLSNAIASGYSTGSVPRPGAIAWSPGHVAYVESVGGGVTVSEMNFWGNGGGWNIVSYRTVPAGSFVYIY